MWVERNGCSQPPDTSETKFWQKVKKREKHTAMKISYAPCKQNAPVILWKLTGAGHVWPGGRQNFMEFILGASTEVIDANEEMWRFFERFSLPKKN
jgi:polyhydroxybutyrate depolymerase